MKKRIILSFIFIVIINTQLTAEKMYDGNKEYEKENYANAFNNYSQAIKEDPDNPLTYINLANTLFHLNEYGKAIEYYKESINKITNYKVNNKMLLAKIYYNMGTCYYYSNDLLLAINSYKTSLRLNPYDQDAKYNWFTVKKLLEENKQGSDSVKPDTENDNNNQNDKQNNDNNENNNNNNDNTNKNNESNQNNNDKTNENDNTNNEKSINQSERQAFLNEMDNKELINRQNVDDYNDDSIDKIDSIQLNYEKDW